MDIYVATETRLRSEEVEGLELQGSEACKIRGGGRRAKAGIHISGGSNFDLNEKSGASGPPKIQRPLVALEACPVLVKVGNPDFRAFKITGAQLSPSAGMALRH